MTRDELVSKARKNAENGIADLVKTVYDYAYEEGKRSVTCDATPDNTFDNIDDNPYCELLYNGQRIKCFIECIETLSNGYECDPIITKRKFEIIEV